jgi:hypothetical protein
MKISKKYSKFKKHGDKQIVLALDTLAKFDFTDFMDSLIHFFDEYVINLLDNENA